MSETASAPDRAVDPVAAAERNPKRRRPPRTPVPSRDYLTRHELLTMVPLGMSTIDDLETKGIFPSRFRLEPTNRVAWKRSEVVKFLEDRAKRRVHVVAKPNIAT